MSKPLTLLYVCRTCGVQVVSPFPNPHYGTPEICPECFLRAKLEAYVTPEDRKRRASADRRRRLKAARARAIAADMEAHPDAVEACVDGIVVDIFGEPT